MSFLPIYSWQNKPAHLLTKRGLHQLQMKPSKDQKIAALATHKYKYHLYDLRHATPRNNQNKENKEFVQKVIDQIPSEQLTP